MNRDELKALLIPVVQAKGAKDDGTPLTADLATTEAAFLNGKFITDIASPSPVGVDGADGVESVPFTLPGKSMEIMPVGLIFYSTYLVIGLSVIMYGKSTE